jgi:23S rRNA (uracil1939-C5)-methyltransferase
VSLKTGDVVELRVTGISSQGKGTAEEDGEPVDVAGALPGDVVEARLLGRDRGRWTAATLRKVSSTIDRIAPRCEHFGVCGGCQWQDVAYTDQLALKREMVADRFRSAGLGNVHIANVIGSEETFHYRNKMDFSFGRNDAGQLLLGLYKGVEDAIDEGDRPRKKVPPVFDLKTCWLQSEASNEIVRTVRDELQGTGLGFYNTAARSGTLRSLVIRDVKATGDILVNLNVARKIHAEGVAEAAVKTSPNVKVFIQSVNRKRSRNAVPRLQETVLGEDRIIERILGLDVQLSATSFAQVNTGQAERLYQLALDGARLKGSETVLDLYCGAGTLSLLLAKQAGKVTGVELLEEAVQDARSNAERNEITNCEFVCKDVLEYVGSQPRGVDVVTVNPPRAGVYRAVLNAICRMKTSRIVYVSCNAETLARDLVVLKRQGYKIGKAQPVDLFPHTHHCEVVVSLYR